MTPPTQQTIEQCRENIGSPPRSFAATDVAGYLHVPSPAWLRGYEDHPSMGFHRYWLAAQEELRRHGRVVWGCVVQANNALYEPGDADSPADLLYCLDPSLDGAPGRLPTIAHRLYSMKGQRQDDRASQTFADALANEHDANPRIPVPPALAGVRGVMFATAIVVRRHLPDGFLVPETPFPVLVAPEHTIATMILPSRFWPASLIDAWRSTGDRSSRQV